ncbi:hypothetical protein BV898_05042 [Hypsibius exemplaris]|uniref:Uncharacterized protein n=1 Tax=Hypsibius exemplaris TaxID=2072580 RepID=A0A1W0X0G3_HYPEX|nr:hypothetical protein BV898_05042 [Hypsibius exemplaris]
MTYYPATRLTDLREMTEGLSVSAIRSQFRLMLAMPLPIAVRQSRPCAAVDEQIEMLVCLQRCRIACSRLARFTGMMGRLPSAWSVTRYYGEYTVYGTGDTVLATFHAHGGPSTGNRKWHMECLDGEAMIGIQDWVNDYNQITQLWCKFMFPNKPPTNGLYPYYPNCFVRNYTTQFHCYQPKEHSASINTFVTALWDNDFQWWQFRGVPDNIAPYKCCKMPIGYHVDYSSCYYMPTKDMYGEYYDDSNRFLVYCATGHVMTGIGKKVNAWSNDAHIEWIQCCRVGLGGPPLYRPPQHTYTYDSYANHSYPNKPSGQFAAQYQGRNLGAQMLPRGFVGSEIDDHESELPALAQGGPMQLPSSRSMEDDDDLLRTH